MSDEIPPSSSTVWAVYSGPEFEWGVVGLYTTEARANAILEELQRRGGERGKHAFVETYVLDEPATLSPDVEPWAISRTWRT